MRDKRMETEGAKWSCWMAEVGRVGLSVAYVPVWLRVGIRHRTLSETLTHNVHDPKRSGVFLTASHIQSKPWICSHVLS